MTTNLRQLLLLTTTLLLLPDWGTSQQQQQRQQQQQQQQPDVTIDGWWSSCSTEPSIPGTAFQNDDFCNGATLNPLPSPIVVDIDACYVNPSQPSVSVSFFKKNNNAITQYHVLFTAPQFATMPTSCAGNGECVCGPDLEQLKRDVGTDCNDIFTFTYQCASLPIWTEEQSCYVPANFTYLQNMQTGLDVNECVMVAQVGVVVVQPSVAPSVAPSIAPSIAATTEPPAPFADIFGFLSSPPSATDLTADPPVIAPSPVEQLLDAAPITPIPEERPTPRPSPNPTPRPSPDDDDDDANSISPGETASAVIFGVIMIVIFVVIGKPCPCQRKGGDGDGLRLTNNKDQDGTDQKSVHSANTRSDQRNRQRLRDSPVAEEEENDDQSYDPEQPPPTDDDGFYGTSAFSKPASDHNNSNSSFARRESGEANVEQFGGWGSKPEPPLAAQQPFT